MYDHPLLYSPGQRLKRLAMILSRVFPLEGILRLATQHDGQYIGALLAASSAHCCPYVTFPRNDRLRA